MIYKTKQSSEDPTWILQRQPNPDKKETYIQIWFKHDALDVSSVAVAQMLADVMKSITKNTT